MKSHLIKLALFCTLLLTLMFSSQAAAPVQAQAFSCSSVTEIPTTECDDLVVLYNTTNGLGWTNQTGWLTTNTPCSWFGITCSAGHVTNITLSSNQLNGGVPNFTNLPNLTNLDLYSNQLSGSIPDFSNLPNLTNLTLGSNQLSGTVPNFSNLPSLRYLYLSSNPLNGSVPNFSNLPNLIGLTLNDNQLSGSVPNFTNLPNLTNLDIYSNQLSGSIPDFTNLPNLQWLNLHSNQLSGSIPNFTNLPNLQYLYLYSNQLSGSVPNFNNLPSLQILNLSSNQLIGTIPNLNWSTFTYLGLYNNCGLVAFDAAQATVLTSKDPNWQQLNPSCPATPTATPTRTPTPLVTLTPTPTPTFSCSNVTEIPTTECDDLVLFYNSTNGPGWWNKTGWLTTNTPCSWHGITCSGGHISQIQLDNNQLSGSVPNFSNLPNLIQFGLTNNQLSGSVPNFNNLPNLQWLYLGGNQLSGGVPNFSNLYNLTDLRLSFNQLSGSVPNFSNLPNLQYLDLSFNQLSGSVPNFSNLPNLQVIALSNNQLNGSVPNFSNLPNLQHLNLPYNQLSGSVPNFSNLPNLQHLDFSRNQLSGTIPNFSNMPSLTSLWLMDNYFTGTIPDLNWSAFSFALYDNCGLVAFDVVQAAILSSKNPDWQRLNPACPATPTPTATSNNPPTFTATPTNMPTATPSMTATIVMTITPTITVTEVITVTPTMTVTEVITVTPTITATEMITTTPTMTVTVTPNITMTGTPTVIVTPPMTVTETPTITVTPTASATATPTPIVTMTPTGTLTPGVTTGVIKGTVLGLGELLSNINVGLYYLDRGWNLVNQTTTDSQGQYQFNELAPGYYRLGIFDWAKNHYLYEFYPNGLIFEEGRLIKVEAGQIISHDIEMEKPSRFRGTVRDKQGNPLPNIAIEVVRYSLTVTGPTWSQVGWAYSQADGSYEVSNLRAGKYRLGFSDSRWPRWYPTKYYPDGNTPAEATLVDLTESVTRTGLDVRLDGPGTIHGRVVNVAGKPIEGIYVQSYQANDAQWNWNGQIQTDSNGEYTLTGLNGSYRLAFFDWLTWPPRYKEIYYNNGQDLATATDVMVTINQTTTVNVTLDKAGKIVGQVLNANSEPVANVMVKALRQTFVTTTSTWIWQPVAWAWTDGSGQYRLENLSKGSYRVGFFTNFDTPYGYYDEVITLDKATEVLVTAGATTSGIDYQLPPPAPALVTASSNTGQVEVSPATGEVNIIQIRSQRSDITISKVVTCANQLAPESVSLQLGAEFYALVLDMGNYTVTIPKADLELLPDFTPNEIKLTVVCSGQPQTQAVGKIAFYDPSGLITDAVTGQPIAQAKVTLYKVDAWHAKIGPEDNSANSCQSNLSKLANQAWSQPALIERGILALAETGEFTPTINPQFTNNDGRYRWDVTAGCWYVQVEAEGYETKISPMVGIPPEVTDLHVALTPKAKFRFETVAYTVNRSTGTSYITVTTGLPVKAKATVDYILSDEAGSQLLTGTLTFETGQAQQPLTLNLKQLATRSSIKHYNLTLTNPTGLSLGLNTEALLSVIDDKVTTKVYLPLIVK